jgi:hypothetical protein
MAAGTTTAEATTKGGAAWAWALIGAIACAAVLRLEPNLLEEG